MATALPHSVYTRAGPYAIGDAPKRTIPNFFFWGCPVSTRRYDSPPPNPCPQQSGAREMWCLHVNPSDLPKGGQTSSRPKAPKMCADCHVCTNDFHGTQCRPHGGTHPRRAAHKMPMHNRRRAGDRLPSLIAWPGHATPHRFWVGNRRQSSAFGVGALFCDAPCLCRLEGGVKAGGGGAMSLGGRRGVRPCRPPKPAVANVLPLICYHQPSGARPIRSRSCSLGDSSWGVAGGHSVRDSGAHALPAPCDCLLVALNPAA